MQMNRREFLDGLFFMAGASALGGCRWLGTGDGFDAARTVFISDVHVGPEGYQLGRFARVVDEILALSPRPKNVVCFGDIAYLRGTVEDYRASRPQFQRLLDAGIRLTFGLGNHDRRRNFLEVWPEYRERMLMDEFVVSEADLGTCDLLMLDTLHEPDNPEAEKRGWITDGQFKEKRLAWLKAEVARRRRPFFLAAHHPIHEITDGDHKAVNDIVMETKFCVGWIHGHDHAWKSWLLRNSKSKWGDNDFKRSLCLPSTGHWGDIGYAVAQSDAGSLRVDYRGLDHYFPTPEGRTALDDDLIAEKRGAFLTFRWGWDFNSLKN